MPEPRPISVFKTASFRIYQPTNHKRAMLRYALRAYHENFAALLERCLSDPGFKDRCASVRTVRDKEVTSYHGLTIEKEARKLLQLREWACAPLRDYLIFDIASTLGSYFAPRKDAATVTNRPTIPNLEPVTDEEMASSLSEFLDTIDYGDFQLSTDGAERVAALRKQGMPRHAERLEKALLNREAGKQIGRILRRTDPAAFRPIEFTRCETVRGFTLLHRDGRFYVGLFLFGRASRYFRKIPIDGFVEWKTRNPCSGKKPMLILPLELSRDFHDEQFLKRGSPLSAKLICRTDDAGEEHFFVNVVFRFDPEPIETTTILGIDRGWVKIASATLIDFDRRTVQSGIDFEGSGFFAQQRLYEAQIAQAQSNGTVSRRKFRLRGRAADNALGEFANRLVAFAVEHKSQIVIERLNALSMSRFLRRSQIARLKDLLDYKTKAAGLPKPTEVPAAYSSQTCVECGHRDPKNRPKQDEKGKGIQHIFRCVRCGHEANADNNASRFIALRGLHRVQSKASGNAEFTFESFLKWLVS